VGNHSLSNHVDEINAVRELFCDFCWLFAYPILVVLFYLVFYFPALQPKWWYNFSLPENAEVSACPYE
jgi:hypothetical protein